MKVVIQARTLLTVRKEIKGAIICSLLCLCLLAFAPPVAFAFSVLGLICLGHFYSANIKSYFAILSLSAFSSIIVAAASHPIFLFAESDFTIYYYNYQQFLDYGFDRRFFFFAGGVEVGVPLVNYWLSIIIDAPMPYLVKVGHAFLQTSLLCFCIIKISKYHGLTLKETSILLALTFLFFKYGSTLNHLRQGYSSLFIILALFSSKYRWLFLSLALLFHLSAIVIYPLVKFLLTSKNDKLLFRFAFCFIIIGCTFYLMLKPLSDILISSNYKLLGKLLWAFRKAVEGDNILTSLKGTLFASIYFIPLLAIGVYARLFYNRSVKYNANLVAMLGFLIGFGFLPGLSVRVLSLILLIMMGYLYFVYFYLELKFKQSLSISLIFLFFFMINWMVFSPFYFYQYPMFSHSPFYYASVYFTEKKAIRRYSLPSQEDIIIKSPHKL